MIDPIVSWVLSMKSLFSFPLFFISSEKELASSENLGLPLRRLQGDKLGSVVEGKEVTVV